MSFNNTYGEFKHGDDMVITSSNFYKSPQLNDSSQSTTRKELTQEEETEYYKNFHKYAKFEDDINENYADYKYYDEVDDDEYDSKYGNTKNLIAYINQTNRSTPSSDDVNTGYSADDSTDEIVYGESDMVDVVFSSNVDEGDINADIFSKADNYVKEQDIIFDVGSEEDIPETVLDSSLQSFLLEQSVAQENKQNLTIEHLSQQACFNGGSKILTLNELLNENARNQNKKLVLSGQHILMIPEVLAQYEWVEELVIRNTKIQKIENLPTKLTDLTIENNLIPVLNGHILPNTIMNLKFTMNKTLNIVLLKEGIINLDLSYNSFSEVRCLIPSTVQTLKISYNKNFHKLPMFENEGENLRTLEIASTQITCIDELPNSIIYLDTSECPINTVNKLPKNLTVWKSYKSEIKQICCEFPDGLSEIDISDSKLETCPNFNAEIKTIDISSNFLVTIPDFPFTVQSVDVTNNIWVPSEEIEVLKKALPRSISFKGGNSGNTPVNSIETSEPSEPVEIVEPTECVVTYPEQHNRRPLNPDNLNARYQYGLGVNNGYYGIQNAYQRYQRYQSTQPSEFAEGLNFANFNRFNRINFQQPDSNYDDYSESNPHYIILPRRAVILE
jgi:hypothetical protein